MSDRADPGHKTLRASALCVSPDVRASRAGAAILRQGGNAFDAAAAAGFVAAVVSPHDCGIGGYAAAGVGFLAKARKPVALDANAVAPRAAFPGMFPVVPARDPNDYRLAGRSHREGPLSVAVPGVLGGLLTLLETWGTLGRQAVMASAIRQAREGVELPPGRALTWHTLKARAEGLPAPVLLDAPSVVPMPELADTLEAIAAGGADVFYSGPIGRAIADHVRRLGGIITRADLAAYRAFAVEPVTFEVRGHTLLTPPPGAGGLTSLQMTGLFDRLERNGLTGAAGTARAFEAFLEVAKVAWEARLTGLGDPSAMSGPAQGLLTEPYLDGLLVRVREGLAHPRPGRVLAPDPLRGTVHLAAADSDGNVVAWTQTHGGQFGSGVMVPGTGVVLGHGMSRFEPRPGWVNSIAPGKRPLHNMAPVVAVRGGQAGLAVGASGGRTIVNNCAAVLIGRLIFGLDPGRALASPRLQCETAEPAVIEAACGAECLHDLRARGHALTVTDRDAGNAHLIARDGDAWVGAAEPREPAAAVVAV